MTTLFSPIGTADPITQLGDGPMLHIVRMRKPDKVVLFLSPAMMAHQNDDQRYTRSIELLCDATGQGHPKVELVESPYNQVHRFDHYIIEFEELLKRLPKSEMNVGILVNVSSGSPAMEQALVALGAFGQLNLELIQVPTPRKGENDKNDRENPDAYDLDVLWALNPDNERVECRAESIELPNFKERLLKDNIATRIGVYDYDAAASLACKSSTLSQSAMNGIKAAADRLRLSRGGTDHAVSEFLSVMEVRLRQGNYGDFTRMVTPAFTHVMKSVLHEVLPEEKYLKRERDGSFGDKLDESSIREDQRLSGVFCRLSSSGISRFITNECLSALVEEYCEDVEVKSLVSKLRRFEKKVRNGLAHEIREVRRERIEEEGGMPLQEVLDSLMKLTGSRSGYYDDLNKGLLGQLKK